MTTRPGAWALRSALTAALVAGLLTAVPSPALADHNVNLANVSNVRDLQAGGGTQNVTIRVQNQGQHPPETGATTISLTLTVPGSIGVFIAGAAPGCNLRNETAMDCTNVEIAPGATFEAVVQIGAQGNAPIPAGESRTEAAQVSLTSHNQNRTFNVQVRGPDRPPSTPEVSGTVTDQNNGQPIGDARVLLVDSQGQDFETTTNAQGQFRFTGEIAAGRIAIRVSRSGFQGGETSHTATAGQPLTGLQLTMISTASPTPTPSPTASPTPTPSGSPSPEPVLEPASSGMSFFTMLMIILGVLFVALGVGAIVLLIIRQRRRAAEEEEGDEGPEGADDPTSGPLGPGPGPGSHGVYRPTPTQVAGAAQTQVIGPGGAALPAVGPRPALADATAMMQRPSDGGADQTAMLPRTTDPNAYPPGPRAPVPGGHGSPAAPRPASPQQPGYGNAPGTYDGRRAGGGYGAYDEPTGRIGRSAPDQERAYRSEAAYGAEPAPGYRPDSYGPDPYTQPSSSGRGYGHQDDGYARPDARPDGYGSRSERRGHERGYDQAGYDQAGNDQAGYDRGGYDQAGYDRGGYDQAGYDRGGYDQAGYDRGGYDQAGYDRGGYQNADYQGASHGQAAGYDQAGYGQAGYGRAGYDERGYAPEDPRNAADDRRDAGRAHGYGQAPEQREGDPDYYDQSRSPRRPAEQRRLDWLD